MRRKRVRAGGGQHQQQVATGKGLVQSSTRLDEGASASLCVQQGHSSTAPSASPRAVQGGQAGRSGVRQAEGARHGDTGRGALRACQSEEARLVTASAEGCSHGEERS